jgi:hypothetical protein
MRALLHKQVVIGITVTLGVLVSSGAAVAQTPPMPPPGDFVSRIDNPYFPLVPPKILVYTGVKDGQARRSAFTITPLTKKILGVNTRVISDNVTTAAGIPIEVTLDYFAQDRAGNVWYFGEDSYDFVKGHFERSNGSWRAGVDGATAGVVMLAHPKVGDSYQQEHYAGHAEDEAKVIGFVDSVTVPKGTYHHVLVTEDTTPLSPGDVDHKFYAPGVGFIQSKAVNAAEHVELRAIIG